MWNQFINISLLISCENTEYGVFGKYIVDLMRDLFNVLWSNLYPVHPGTPFYYEYVVDDLYHALKHDRYAGKLPALSLWLGCPSITATPLQLLFLLRLNTLSIGARDR